MSGLSFSNAQTGTWAWGPSRRHRPGAAQAVDGAGAERLVVVVVRRRVVGRAERLAVCAEFVHPATALGGGLHLAGLWCDVAAGTSLPLASSISWSCRCAYSTAVGHRSLPSVVVPVRSYLRRVPLSTSELEHARSLIAAPASARRRGPARGRRARVGLRWRTTSGGSPPPGNGAVEGRCTWKEHFAAARCALLLWTRRSGMLVCGDRADRGPLSMQGLRRGPAGRCRAAGRATPVQHCDGAQKTNAWPDVGRGRGEVRLSAACRTRTTPGVSPPRGCLSGRTSRLVLVSAQHRDVRRPLTKEDMSHSNPPSSFDPSEPLSDWADVAPSRSSPSQPRPTLRTRCRRRPSAGWLTSRSGSTIRQRRSATAIARPRSMRCVPAANHAKVAVHALARLAHDPAQPPRLSSRARRRSSRNGNAPAAPIAATG